jgi:hypothetical protein
MTVRGVVHLTSGTSRTLFLSKYENVFRGGTEDNLHVEDLVVADRRLEEALCSPYPNKTLTIYVSYQPCHHSGGGRKLVHVHGKSCSRLIASWWKQKLQPRNVDFRFKCCGLYRAHWEDSTLFRLKEDVDMYGARSGRAREGLQLLNSGGIRVEGMNDEDWKRFLSWCDPKITAQISEDHWQRRKIFDEKVREFLGRQRDVRE